MITGINHVTFATRDLAQSLDFYCELLKFKLIVKWKKGAYLTANNIWLCLSCDTKTKSQIPEEYTHIAFTVNPETMGSLNETVLKKKIPQWKENTSEGASLYLLDPDFNKIEIHCGDLNTRLRHIIQTPYEEMEIYLTNDELESLCKQ